MQNQAQPDQAPSGKVGLESITDRLLTKTELSKLLRKSNRTIEYWVNAGYLSCIRIAHSVLFDREQVIADLKRFECGPRTSITKETQGR